jgi:hypothetical protein
MSIGFIALAAVTGVACIALTVHLFRRLEVVLLTMRARAWMPSASRLLSAWVNAVDYCGDAFFGADGADARTCGAAPRLWIACPRRAELPTRNRPSGDATPAKASPTFVSRTPIACLFPSRGQCARSSI